MAGGHLKFVSFDENAEDLLVRTGVAGAWKTNPGADWLSLRSVNVLPNKIDWFLRRSMTVDAVVDPTTGAIESTVTVTLRNLAPASGLPSYLISNNDGLPQGTNRDSLSLYTPHALDAITLNGTSVGAESKDGYGGRIYTLPVVLPPGGEATVVYRLKGQVVPGPVYRLDLLNQPLAHDDDVTVRIRGNRQPEECRALRGSTRRGRGTDSNRQVGHRTFAKFRKCSTTTLSGH